MIQVDETICSGCGDCVAACPAGAISLAYGRAWVDQPSCTGCASCADACPSGAIALVDAVVVNRALQPMASISAAPLVASEEAGSLARRPPVELLPAQSRLSRFWPMVGSALVWAGRELLPEIIAAWQASRADSSQASRVGLSSTSRFLPVRSSRGAARRGRGGRRHRWGRA